MTFMKKKLIASGLLATSLVLVGCGDDDDPVMVEPEPTPMPTPMTYSFEVTVTNLTNAQPVSPVAVVMHDEGNVWQLGEMASNALEVLAESGDNSNLLAESFVMASASGEGVIMPGMSETITVSMTDMMPNMVSVVTMLVNTNDAFSGFNAMDISNLEVGESISLRTGSYDAGTEKNTESMASIPGPAAGGEGYNEARDDVDFVAMHPGVVSMDDGLMSSVLTEAHRFDNPTLAITFTRTE